MAISKFWLEVFGEIVGVGGVLVALQLLSTVEKGIDYWLLRQPIAILKLLSDAFRKNTRWEEGVSTLPTLWISERTLYILTENPMNLLRSLYEHPF